MHVIRIYMYFPILLEENLKAHKDLIVSGHCFSRTNLPDNSILVFTLVTDELKKE